MSLSNATETEILQYIFDSVLEAKRKLAAAKEEFKAFLDKKRAAIAAVEEV